MYSDDIGECRDGLLILQKPNTGVSLHVANFMIERCTYWNHPKAGWVNAPKHAERIKKSHYGYEINFGANCFLVELAVKRCVSEVSKYLDLFEDDPYSTDTLDDLRALLKHHVSGAVANVDGAEYRGFYPMQGNKMVFGTAAIDAQKFAGIIVATSKIQQLYDLYF
jgi:hypothetical protein